MPPSKKLEDLTHLADLCVELLQQNNEQYSEVRPDSSLSVPATHSQITASWRLSRPRYLLASL